MNVDSDVVDFLDTNIDDLTKGTNLFQGDVLSISDHIPTNAVFIQTLAGGAPERSMGEDSELRRPQVNIVIRWSTHAAGETLTREIQDTLQGATVTGYQDLIPLQSAPNTIERNQGGDRFWTLMYELVYDATAS